MISVFDALTRLCSLGVAGGYITVFHTYPHKHVNIIVTDNHNINSFPISTVGALYRPQDVQVVIIMHQYAYHEKWNTIDSSVHI